MLTDGLFKYFNTMYMKIAKDIDKAVKKEDTEGKLQNIYLRGDSMAITLCYKGVTKSDFNTEAYLSMWLDALTPCCVRINISIKRPDKGKFSIDVVDKKIMFKSFDPKKIAKQLVENAIA